MNRKDDIDILARTIYGEARNQGLKGMEAVACVVINRVRAKKYFTGYMTIDKAKIPSVAETCLKPMQFSCWNSNDPNRKLIENIGIDDAVFRECLSISNRAVCGQLNDITKSSTHYHTKTVSPKWANGKVPCVMIGAHLFYNNID